jgi:arylsulfatase A-like enzyme
VVAQLRAILDARRVQVLEEAAARDGQWFDSEMQKLDRWADDRKVALEQELRDLDRSIAEARRCAAIAGTLSAKLEAQKQVKELEAERARRRKDYFAAQDDVDARKGRIIDEIAARMGRTDELTELFTIRWSVV